MENSKYVQRHGWQIFAGEWAAGPRHACLSGIWKSPALRCIPIDVLVLVDQIGLVAVWTTYMYFNKFIASEILLDAHIILEIRKCWVWAKVNREFVEIFGLGFGMASRDVHGSRF